MYPIDPTHTEELIKAIEEGTPKVTETMKEIIDDHEASVVPKMQEGVRYYFNQSDITKRKIYTYENDVKVVDEDATNQKLPSAWHKRLVDQKVGYLAGKPPTLTSETEDDPNQAFIEEQLGDEFEDTIPELIKHVSNKGKEYLHPYIDSEGNFEYMIVSATEYIPIVDQRTKEQIGGIRIIDLNDDTRKIELWDSEQVTYYEEIDGEIVLDVSVDQNPQSHFYYGQNGYGWGKVPFIEFKNNEEGVSDLTWYKALIDAHELINSELENTIIDVQTFIWVLQGYEGTSLNEFMTNLKRYKAISVSDEPGSGANIEQGDTPINAVDSHLDRLEQLIYEAGQGVQFSADQLGNNPTGVSLKFLYTALDLKASVLQRKFRKSLREFLWFICEYLTITGSQVDYTNYDFTFNVSMITNETEQIKNSNESVGNISDETRLANHPWVDDVQMELERLERQQNEYMRNMPNIGEE